MNGFVKKFTMNRTIATVTAKGRRITSPVIMYFLIASTYVKAEFYARREQEANFPEYWANEYEPVPAHQVSTDRITELLGA